MLFHAPTCLKLSLALMFSIFSFVGTPKASAATPLKGAYSKAVFYAAGGRVNVEAHHLYLNVEDARAYAAKSEISIAEGIAWFGGSFIPKVGPFISTLGLLKSIEASLFVSEIRKYTDQNSPVLIVISKDNFNSGFASRAVTAWGNAESVKYPDELNTDYRTSEFINRNDKSSCNARC